MKKYKLIVIIETDDTNIVQELKNLVLSGELQRDFKKDDRIKKVITTFEEIK